MADLPADWGALCALALVLGLKHGLDADHLATIDGLTRLAAGERRRHARWCGALFSIGHGAVVVAIVVALGSLHGRWQAPGWLDATGTAISLTFLLALGIANLRRVLATPPDEVVRPVGLKGRLLAPALHSPHPLVAAAVGALFAFSFDTVSQAALFAVAGDGFGPGSAVVLALLFVLGMLITDGVNGLWISRLLARADRLAARASRLMSAAVAAVSLGVAAFGVARWVSPAAEAWAETRGSGLFGGIVVAVLLASYGLAHWWARRARPAWAA